VTVTTNGGGGVTGILPVETAAEKAGAAETGKGRRSRDAEVARTRMTTRKMRISLDGTQEKARETVVSAGTAT
jgi:hypothetical protein